MTMFPTQALGFVLSLLDNLPEGHRTAWPIEGTAWAVSPIHRKLTNCLNIS